MIQKFEPANVRDDFEYAFMFSKALEGILPKKEADPYLDDFKYAGKIRQMIRTYYEGVGQSLRVDGKKVQQLIDDHIRSLNISELMNPREITYDNFLSYVSSKFKSDRARTALVKNKARQVIRDLSLNNPVYYEKLRERLEKIIGEEKERRKKDADYFNDYKKILQEALDEDKERKKIGLSTMFEFAVYEELRSIIKDNAVSKSTAKTIFDQIKKETEIVGWKSKISSKKKMSIITYDILTDNNVPDGKVTLSKF
jgi:type I restriction enzyme, R subunit